MPEYTVEIQASNQDCSVTPRTMRKEPEMTNAVTPDIANASREIRLTGLRAVENLAAAMTEPAGPPRSHAMRTALAEVEKAATALADDFAMHPRAYPWATAEVPAMVAQAAKLGRLYPRSLETLDRLRWIVGVDPNYDVGRLNALGQRRAELRAELAQVNDEIAAEVPRALAAQVSKADIGRRTGLSRESVDQFARPAAKRWKPRET